MSKVNPRAYLSRIKNVKRGIDTRSRILEIISSKPSTLKNIAEEVKRSNSSVRRHLKNMEAEGIVKSYKYKRRVIWTQTGMGQTELDLF
ncbi:MAG: winged helix-turn-helix domain-containing protein [Candidatus Caldarchaeales archaeon]